MSALPIPFNATRQSGVVVALVPGPPAKVTVQLNGDSAAQQDMDYLSSYTPQVGDCVAVLSAGASHLVIGSVVMHAPVSGGLMFRSGSAWTAATSFNDVTGATVTLPAGNWLVHGKMRFSCAVNATVTTTLQLLNATSAGVLDTASGFQTSATNSDVSLDVDAGVTLTAAATIKLQAKVSVLSGAQNFGNAKIWAIPFALML